MKKVLEARLNILVLIILGIFTAFTLKLVQYQIIDGEEYYSKSNATTRINQTVTAARGDITDVNGIPLAGGQVVFDVTVNKAYMPADKLNERILAAVKILQRQGETINDFYTCKFTRKFLDDCSRLHRNIFCNIKRIGC